MRCQRVFEQHHRHSPMLLSPDPIELNNLQHRWFAVVSTNTWKAIQFTQCETLRLRHVERVLQLCPSLLPMMLCVLFIFYHHYIIYSLTANLRSSSGSGLNAFSGYKPKFYGLQPFHRCIQIRLHRCGILLTP